MIINGIDVSKWQSKIDWTLVKKSEIQFAMIRASYGVNGYDAYFNENMIQAGKMQIDRGAYHYCYAKTVGEAKKEAQFFLSVIKGYQLNYPVALDLEDKSLEALSKSTLTQIALSFLNTIKTAGYYGILYINQNWLKNKLDIHKLKDYDIWLAAWDTDSLPKLSNIGIWQYTDEGNIRGIKGNVDLNRSLKNYPELIKKAGLNHLKEGDSLDITIEEALKIVQEKAQLEERTMEFLMDYKFGDVLIKKLAGAMK